MAYLCGATVFNISLYFAVGMRGRLCQNIWNFFLGSHIWLYFWHLPWFLRNNLIFLFYFLFVLIFLLLLLFVRQKTRSRFCFVFSQNIRFKRCILDFCALSTLSEKCTRDKQKAYVGDWHFSMSTIWCWSKWWFPHSWQRSAFHWIAFKLKLLSKARF